MATSGSRSLAGAIATANAISVAGNVLTLVALVSYLYERTGSPLTVAGVVLLGFAPVSGILPLLGPRLAGRSLRTVGTGVGAVQAAVSLGMAAAAAATAPVAVLYVAVAMQGILSMILRVTVLSNMPRLLPPEQLPGANLLLQVSSQLGAIVGASGLAARGHAPAAVLFLIDAVTFAVQAAVLNATVPPTPAPAPVSSTGTAERTLTMPLRVPLRAYLIVPAGYLALNLLNVTAPLIALERLGSGQRGYALSEVVFPAVAIGAGFVLRRHREVPIAPTLLALAASFLVGAFATNMVLFLLAVGLCGGGMLTANAATQAWVQRDVGAAALPALQSRAAGLGAALSAVGVIGVAAAFGAHADRWALLLCAAWFVWLTGLGVAGERSQPAVEV